jgi:hyperosmotically inducible protein
MLRNPQPGGRRCWVGSSTCGIADSAAASSAAAASARAAIDRHPRGLCTVAFCDPCAAALAADGTVERASPKAFVKDSVITTKIRTELAAEKFSRLIHISVVTDNKGVVVLPDTAKSRAAADKAVSIAHGVKGVVSVQDDIKIVAEK